MAKDEGKKGTGLTTAHISAVEEMLADLRYGSVTLVVQDGRLVQIEKHEKLRLV